MDTKKTISGITATSGAYTLNNTRNILQLPNNNSIRALNSLSKKHIAKEIAIKSGIIASSVLIPPVRKSTLNKIALRRELNSIMGKNESILDTVKHVIDQKSATVEKVINCISKAIPQNDKFIETKENNRTAESNLDNSAILEF